MAEAGIPADSSGPSRHLAAILAVTIAPPALQSPKVDAEIAAAGGTMVGQVDRTRYAEFHNARSAVLCAMRLQGIEHARGLRVGVHLGELAAGEDAPSSRGAQVAALVAGTADPGGLALSNAVYGQVKRMFHLRGILARRGGHRTFIALPQGVSYLPWLLRKRRARVTVAAACLALAVMACAFVHHLQGRDRPLALSSPGLYHSATRSFRVGLVPGGEPGALQFEWGEDPGKDYCRAEFDQSAGWEGGVGIRLKIRGIPGTIIIIEPWERSRLVGDDTSAGEHWRYSVQPPAKWGEVMIPFERFEANKFFKARPENLDGVFDPGMVSVLAFSVGEGLPTPGQFCLGGGSLIRRRRPAAPFVDGPPSGPVSVPAGEDARWSAVPRSAEKLMVRCAFDWGDGGTSETPSLYSGEAVGMAHRWTAPGRYKVRVKAVDIEGRSSALSAPTEVEVTPVDVLLEGFDDLGRIYEWANPGCTVAKSPVPGVHGSALRLICTMREATGDPSVGVSLEKNIANGNWSSFSGLRVQAKCERGTPLYLRIIEKGKGGGAVGGELWDVPLKPGSDWTCLYGAFSEFRPSLERGMPQDQPNGRLDLDSISAVAIFLQWGKAAPRCSETVCIDDLVLVSEGAVGKGGAPGEAGR